MTVKGTIIVTNRRDNEKFFRLPAKKCVATPYSLDPPRNNVLRIDLRFPRGGQLAVGRRSHERVRSSIKTFGLGLIYDILCPSFRIYSALCNIERPRNSDGLINLVFI